MFELEQVPLIRDRAYSLLLDAIISGQLKPGERIREREVAQQMGISTTPVKEALQRLENEHLVIKQPRRGVAVSPVALTSIGEIVELRAYLEGIAARLAAEKCGERAHDDLDPVVARMSESTRHGDAEAAAEHNSMFHRLIREASGNHFIGHFVDVMIAFDGSVRRVALSSSDELQRGLQEHVAVYEAICDGEGQLAEATMREHILRTFNSVVHESAGRMNC